MPGITANTPATAKLSCEVDVLSYLAPSGGVVSGDVVLIAGKAGVVLSNAAEGEPVGVDISRAFIFPNPDLAAVVGTQYAWSIALKKIIATTTGDFELGICVPTVDAPTGADAGAGAIIALNMLA